MDEFTDLEAMRCHKAPPGWRCTRIGGHDGPCAAEPTSLRAGFMRRMLCALFGRHVPRSRVDFSNHKIVAVCRACGDRKVIDLSGARGPFP